MPLTGSIILIYIIFHLLDFTLADKVGVIEGIDYGLFGLVVNYLNDPIHSALYIIAMMSVGLHMYHAFQSVFQTLGVMSQSNQKNFLEEVLGTGTLGFSSIPLYTGKF